MITIAITSFNHGHIISETIESALAQDYQDKEIIVVDDSSVDNTAEIVSKYPVKLYRHISTHNKKGNKGLGFTLNKCVEKAEGDYIIFLASDDKFTNKKVVSDMVNMFHGGYDIVGRYYYQYIDGYKGAVCNVHTNNILSSSCNPSGMGFKKSSLCGDFTNGMFVEVPQMVYKMLSNKARCMIIAYDTIAVRLHRRVKAGHGGNAAILPAYYDRTPREYMCLNWHKLMPGHVWYEGFVQTKNSAPQLLLGEIINTIKIKPTCLISPKFWFCVAVSLLPRCILRRLCDFYRHRIMRRYATIIERG